MARALWFMLILAAVAGAGAQEPRWIDNPAEAEQAWRAEQKPVVLFFYTHQARPAHQLRTETLAHPDIVPRLANFVCVALDQSRYAELGKRFNLVRVPTVIFLDERGRELDRAVGPKPPEDFAIYLDRITRAYVAARQGPEGSTVAPFRSMAIDIMKPTERTQPITFRFTPPRASRVYLVGDFNDWRTEASPMSRGTTAEWSITANLPPGVYEYLYLVDGGTYMPDPRNPLKKMNPYGGTNSVLLVGNPPTSPTVQGNSVFFFLYEAKAKEVQVAGSFNNWQRFTMYQKPGEPGMWGVRYDNMPRGTHQYKYVIDGEWKLDLENYTLMTDTDGNVNSSFAVK